MKNLKRAIILSALVGAAYGVYWQAMQPVNETRYCDASTGKCRIKAAKLIYD